MARINNVGLFLMFISSIIMSSGIYQLQFIYQISNSIQTFNYMNKEYNDSYILKYTLTPNDTVRHFRVCKLVSEKYDPAYIRIGNINAPVLGGSRDVEREITTFTYYQFPYNNTPMYFSHEYKYDITVLSYDRAIEFFNKVKFDITKFPTVSPQLIIYKGETLENIYCYVNNNTIQGCSDNVQYLIISIHNEWIYNSVVLISVLVVIIGSILLTR